MVKKTMTNYTLVKLVDNLNKLLKNTKIALKIKTVQTVLDITCLTVTLTVLPANTASRRNFTRQVFR